MLYRHEAAGPHAGRLFKLLGALLRRLLQSDGQSQMCIFAEACRL